MNNTPSKHTQMQSASSVYGLCMGGFWLACFGCTMYGLEVPLLGILGNFLAILSVVVMARMIRDYRVRVHDLSWPQSLWFALTVCMYATLITTFGQYIYFAFLDRGHFLHVMEALFQNPQYTASLQQSFSEVDTKLLLEVLASMNTRDIILQFLFMNMMAAGACALLGSLMGGIGKVQPRADIKS